MDEKALFLKFWEREAPATRKVISRIPQDKSDYKPEPKSRTAREIAWLIVMEEKVLVEGLEKGTLEWQDLPTPATVEEILATYDQNHEGPYQASTRTRRRVVGERVQVRVRRLRDLTRDRLPLRLGVLVRYRASSRAAFDLLKTNGLDGAFDLRSKRR